MISVLERCSETIGIKYFFAIRVQWFPRVPQRQLRKNPLCFIILEKPSFTASHLIR